MVVECFGIFGGIVGSWCFCCFGFLEVWVGLFVCLKNPKLIWPDNTVFEMKWQNLASVI